MLLLYDAFECITTMLARTGENHIRLEEDAECSSSEKNSRHLRDSLSSPTPAPELITSPAKERDQHRMKDIYFPSAHIRK